MLIKYQIDKYVLEDALRESVISEDLRHELSRVYEDANDAKKVLVLFKSSCPTGGQDGLIIDELKEICKDLRWSKTKRGALITECNDLAPILYKKIRGDMGYTDVVIGAHTERLAVVIAGNVPSPQAKDAVVTLIKDRFKYPIVDKVMVNSPPGK